MTRRSAAGPGRLLLIPACVLVVVAGALLAACGGPSPSPATTVTVTPSGTAAPSASPSPSVSPSASPTTAAKTVVRPYFLRGEKLGVAERRVPATIGVASATMQALLAGPTASERAAGLSTAIPAGTRLLGLKIESGTASVDLSGEFGSGGGSASMSARVAEVVYTLTRYATIRSVRFLMDGKPVEALGGEGLVLTEPQRRADWRDLEPNIFVESPGVGAVVPPTFTLSGTAMVFEGSFQAQLLDSSGHRLASVVIQASRGAPGRGLFSKSLSYSTSAHRGTLIVFDRSMEDGSRQDEVRIPVTFGPVNL